MSIGLAVLVVASPPAMATQRSGEELAPVVDAGAQYVPLSASARAVRDAIAASVPANEYGGISWDHNNNLTVVYLKSTPAAARVRMSAVGQIGGAVAVSRRLGERSLASLQALSDQVWSRLPKATIKGVTGVTIDPWTNRVQIQFSTVTTGERAAARTAFGDAVEVSQAAARHVLSGRFDDSAPFIGGDRLIIGYSSGNLYGGCSGGYAATYSSTRVLVTAGHCAPYNAVSTPTHVWTGGLHGEAGCTSSACLKATLGTVWQTRMPAYTTLSAAQNAPVATDVALITGSGSPFSESEFWAHAGGVTSITTFPGAGYSPGGDGQVCQAGATSLGWCYFTTAANSTVIPAQADDGVYLPRMRVWLTTAVTTGDACSGDSGGTVYRVNSSSSRGLYGTVSVSNGSSVPGHSGCTYGFGFTWWGDAQSVLPGISPVLP